MESVHKTMKTRADTKTSVPIMLNGRPHQHSGDMTIPSLLTEIGAQENRVAVAVDSCLISRANWDSVQLSSNMVIDIVTFVAGG